MVSLLFTVFIGFIFAVTQPTYAFHASCSMSLTLSNTTIATVNASLVKMVQSREGFNASTCVYASLQNEFCGYSIEAISDISLHFKHETPVHHYIDDIKFQDWQQKGADVVVEAMSNSESPSAYDYDTNFCNIFNLFRNGDAEKMNFGLAIEYQPCLFHPETANGKFAEAFKHCDEY